VYSDRELLERFRPVLRYDSRELYYADSAHSFLENFFAGGPAAPYGNVLRGKDGSVIASAGDDPADPNRLRLDFLIPEGGKYTTGESVSSDDYLDASTKAYIADARRYHEVEGMGNVIYGAMRPGAGGKRWLQYWFFFYYNDKAVRGFGVHEGDWEGIQIRIGPPGEDSKVTPEEVTYSQHEGGERAGWDEVELDEETGAPVVYVGLGSHASYLRSGQHQAPIVADVCDGGGAHVRPALELLDEEEQVWVRWPGRWGASKKRGLISFPSPESPGKQRRWDHPDDYHGDAEQFDERRTAAEEEPAAPVVTARREGDTVHVEVNAAPGTAAKLVVPAVIDGLPQGLEYDLSDLPEGEALTLRPAGDATAAASGPDDDRL
jgi:hypothetical protein